MQKFPPELSKAYQPKEVDPKWYAFWMEHHLFKADAKSKKNPYCIVMPPPNVTGVLHMGHALVNTLQDILIRWKRMSGFEVLWVPGTDHAGIATQTVVERHLFKTEGKKRKDYSREAFLENMWAWKEINEHTILDQLKKLGCSCDWSRLRFTMDQECNQAVRVMFKKLFDKGLIYRGDYLVNWDPVTQTALADDEVEYEEREGTLTFFNYPIEGTSETITIATTRPETMLGDTAIAVSPKDPRYQHLIGKNAIQPLTKRALPIIQDPYVDPEFGTGAVKITPAHDPNDYKIGLSHKLPMINIMTEDGKVNENGGEFKGLPFDEARVAVTQKMKELGFFVKTVPHINRIGIAYRSKAVIEPFLSKQWFVRMDTFAKELKTLLESGEFSLIPENFKNTYNHWVSNLRDWCISRQLWWGHRIPIWYHKKDKDKCICYDGEGLPKEVLENPDDWEQDEDVLDTWFSSALWPFSTLGFPNQTDDLAKFYPNSTLITGHDILFFWVARMLAFGKFTMGKAPFKEAYLHGLIYGKSYWRTSKEGQISYVTGEERLKYDLGTPLPQGVQFKWEKMSKSKGNVIDPLEIIEEYGTDAMRITLAASATESREIDLDRRRFEDFRNFANKIWNGARFVIMNLEGENPLLKESLEKPLDFSSLRLEDKWILVKLSKACQEVSKHLENYSFDKAALASYDFFWKEFCAYYVEMAKPALFNKRTKEEREIKQKVLFIVLLQAIRLLHPFAPFITEELFQRLKESFGDAKLHSSQDPLTQDAINALQQVSIVTTSYPKPNQVALDTATIEEEFSLIDGIIYTIRNLRGEMGLAINQASDVILSLSKTDPLLPLIENNLGLLFSLVKIREVHVNEEEPSLALKSSALYRSIKVTLPLPEELLKAEIIRLEKEAVRLQSTIDRSKTQLLNQEFLERAPPQLVEKQKKTLETQEKELQHVLEKLEEVR